MKSVRRLLYLLMVLAAAGAGASAREAAPKQYAVVVGINTYESPDVNPLHYAVNDARAFAAALRAAGFDRVYEFTTDKHGSETYPNRTNIIFRLGQLRDRLRPQDSLVFYFSGHGMELGGRTFLLTKESDPRSADTLTESSCRAEKINEILAQVKARRILVVYDACRSNPRADKGGEANLLRKQTAKDLVLIPHRQGSGAHVGDYVMATLFACSEGQRSYEWNDREHGYFTYYLIQGLKGQAARQGKVTVGALIDYVVARVKDATEDAGCHQQPYAEVKATSLNGWVLSHGFKGGAVETTAATPTPPSAPATASAAASAPGTKAPDPAVAYLGYLHGTATLGFSPGATLFKQVHDLIRSQAFDDVPDATLYGSVAEEVTTLVKAAGLSDDAMRGLPADESLIGRVLNLFGGRVDRDLLWYAMVRGMLKGMGDPYSVLLTPNEYKALMQQMENQTFGGVGMYLELDHDNGNQLTVVEPIEGTPAFSAGLQPGDQILEIDGKSTHGMTLEMATAAIRGQIGTSVTFLVRRAGQASPLTLTVTRASIRVVSVSHKLLPGGIGYLRVRVFGASTGQEVASAVDALQKDGAKSLVLDLRNNGGGYLTAAVDVCSSFLEPDTLVSYLTDRQNTRHDYKTRAHSRVSLPLVVLVNHYSASASEITAGCLKDHRRATLVGTRTFGKGSVQKLYPLQDGAMLKLTTDHFFSPSGGRIQGAGITPDQIVEMNARNVEHPDRDVQLQRAIQLLTTASPTGVEHRSRY